MRAVRVILLSALLEGVAIPPARAADVVTTIPVATLNAFAAAVGTVRGSGSYDLGLNTLVAIEQPAAQPPPVPPPAARPSAAMIPVAYHLVPRVILLQSVPWNWSVAAPTFTVAPTGVTFSAYLTAQTGKQVMVQRVQLPVTVQFDSAASTFRVSVSNSSVPVFLTIAGRYTQVGTVPVGSYYSTQLHVASSSFNIPGKTVTGSVKNVGVQLQSGTIRITNDVQFQ